MRVVYHNSELFRSSRGDIGLGRMPSFARKPLKSVLTTIRRRNKFLSPGTSAIFPRREPKPKRDVMALVNDPKSSWQELYQAALAESDKEKLTQLVMTVEEAMFVRAQGLSDSRVDDKERTLMAEATQKLLIIKTEKLGWPGFKPE
jgi:hypothetical protein